MSLREKIRNRFPVRTGFYSRGHEQTKALPLTWARLRIKRGGRLIKITTWRKKTSQQAGKIEFPKLSQQKGELNGVCLIVSPLLRPPSIPSSVTFTVPRALSYPAWGRCCLCSVSHILMDLQEHIHVIQAGWAAPLGHPAGNTSGQWDTAGGCWLMIVRQDFVLFRVPCNTQQIKYAVLKGNQLPRGDQKTLLKMTLWLRSTPQKCFTVQRHLWGYWVGETGCEDQQGQPVTRERPCLLLTFPWDIPITLQAQKVVRAPSSVKQGSTTRLSAC